jgi:hypothetical protein
LPAYLTIDEHRPPQRTPIGRTMSRRCGQTWRDTWRIAAQYDPPIVMIETWNDLEEGTDIEFGTEDRFYLPLVMKTASTITGE